MTDPAAPTPRARLSGLDGLRGVAAIAVVWYHLIWAVREHVPQLGKIHVSMSQWYLGPVWSPIYYGRMGVQLFFMISGFVIIWTLQRTERMFDFGVSRFARLYPAYWAGMAITVATVAWLQLPDAVVHGRVTEVHRLTAPQIALNATMLAGFAGKPYVDSAYWSLTAELAFYLFAALVLRRTIRDPERLMRVVVVAVAVSTVISFVGTPDSGPAHKVVALAKLLTLAGYAHLFGVGVAAFLRWSRPDPPAVTRWVILAAPAMHLLATRDAGEALAMVPLTWLFLRAIDNRWAWLEARPVQFLGRISYPMYLVHQFVGYAVVYQLSVRHHWSVWLSMPIAIAVGVGVGWVLSVVVERPAMTAIKTAYRRRRRPVGAAAA